MLMDTATQRKWDAASRTLDRFAWGDDRRLGPHKRRLFSKIHGATLMVAAGTGNDFKFFPPGHHIVAIDISPKMLEHAALKAAAYQGALELRVMDVCALSFADASFDTVVTVCTFCSVPRPILGLRELHRVLKPGGQVLMFEHVRSKIGLFGVLLDLMTPLPDFLVVSQYLLGFELGTEMLGRRARAGKSGTRSSRQFKDLRFVTTSRLMTPRVETSGAFATSKYTTWTHLAKPLPPLRPRRSRSTCGVESFSAMPSCSPPQVQVWEGVCCG
jgi:SAM-dependent methyltransferase